jgi:acetyl esterase/lipase
MLLVSRGLPAAGLPPPIGILAVSPFLDIDDATDHSTTSRTEVFIGPKMVDFVKTYESVICPADDAHLWSVNTSGDPTGFPPLFVSTNDHEICAQEIQLWADRCTLKKNKVTLYKDDAPLFHASLLFYKLCSEGRLAMDAATHWLKQVAHDPLQHSHDLDKEPFVTKPTKKIGA